MKIYEVEVKEISVAIFHVQANSAHEAEQLFAEKVNRDLSKNGDAYWLESAIEDGYQGYEYSATEAQMLLGVPLDFNYEELIEDVEEE